MSAPPGHQLEGPVGNGLHRSRDEAGARWLVRRGRPGPPLPGAPAGQSLGEDWVGWRWPSGKRAGDEALSGLAPRLSTLLRAAHAVGLSHGGLCAGLVFVSPDGELVLIGLVAGLEGKSADEAALAGLGVSPRTEAPVSGPGAEITILTTDPAGMGVAVRLLVLVQPGTGRVEALSPCDREAEVAAQVAAATALGDRNWDLRWQIRGGARVSGASLGLGLAVAALAAREGRALPTQLAATGGVDLDGRVVAVGGMPAKLATAERMGLGPVLVPADTPPGPGRVPLARLADLPAGLRSRRRLPLRGLGLLLAAVLGLAGATAPLDHRLEDALLPVGVPPLPLDAVVVLALPDGPAPASAWRTAWPDLLQSLHAAGARAVILDVYLGGGAVPEALSSPPLPLILPVRSTEGSQSPPVVPEGPRVRHGIAETQRGLLDGRARRLVVSRLFSNGDSRWHIAVLGAAAALNSEPVWEGDRLRIPPLSVEAPARRLRLPPFEAAPRLKAPMGPEGPWPVWTGARDKLVVVGFEPPGSDRQELLGGRPVSGLELVAAEAQLVLSQAPLREAGLAVRGGLSLLGLLLAFGAGRLHRWGALGIGLLGVALVLALAPLGLVVPLCPLMLACAAGGWLQRGR